MRRGACAALVVLAGCGRGDPAPRSAGPAPEIEQVRALVVSAPLIVTGVVAEIEPGRTAAGLDMETVRIVVDLRLKGSSPDTVLLEQPAPPGRIVSGQGGYEPGQRWLLFLRPSRTEDGIRVVVPQGRYGIEDGRLRSASPGPLADAWDGAVFAEVLDQIRRALGKPD